MTLPESLTAEYPQYAGNAGPDAPGPDETECLRCGHLATDHAHRNPTGPDDAEATAYRVCPHVWQQQSPGSAVCGTCGLSGANPVHDLARLEAHELDPDVLAVLGAAGDALATALGPLVGKIETARNLAVRLEQENAEAREVIAGLLGHAGLKSSTWATDSAAIERAQAFLE